MSSESSGLRNWLRVGRRFEYTILAISIVWFLTNGLMLTRGTPSEPLVLWILWLSAGVLPFFLAVLAFAFGPRVRGMSGQRAATSEPRALASRLLVYLLIAAVAITTVLRVGNSLLEKHLASATAILRFLVLDLAFLAAYIIWNEFRIQRKRRRA